MLGGCSLQVGGCKYKGGAAGSLSEMSEDDGGQRFYLGIVAGSCATLLGLTNLPPSLQGWPRVLLFSHQQDDLRGLLSSVAPHPPHPASYI